MTRRTRAPRRRVGTSVSESPSGTEGRGDDGTASPSAEDVTPSEEKGSPSGTEGRSGRVFVGKESSSVSEEGDMAGGLTESNIR